MLPIKSKWVILPAIVLGDKAKQAKEGIFMAIQSIGASSNLATQLQTVSARLSLNQQEQQGQAALQLIAASAPPPAPSGSVGSIINTTA